MPDSADKEKDANNDKSKSSENTKADKADKKGDSADSTNVFDQVFTKSNIVIIIWFLAVYIIVSFIMGLTSTNYSVPNDRMIILFRMIDFVVLAFGVIMLVLSFFYRTEQEKEEIVEEIYNALVNYTEKPIHIVSVGLFLVVLYMFIMILGIPMDQNKPVTVYIIENVAWILFSISIIAGFFKYVLHISIGEFLTKWFDSIWNSKPKPEVAETPEKERTDDKQVFNISNNLYTYDDAKAVCKSMDARLATYDEIEDAYENGAEWCNYGWSENQSIYFPTQKKTWEELQKTTSHKNDCGRPGVNGGYMDNPHIRFGANCYGNKPKPSDRDIHYASVRSDDLKPKTPGDLLSNMKVDFFKKYKDDFIQLNAFNKEKWSEY
jgi:hypothetical protein